jgi:hypothetical protein
MKNWFKWSNLFNSPWKLKYISAWNGEDFSNVALLASLNSCILFTKLFLAITLTNKLLYGSMILPVLAWKMNRPDYTGFLSVWHGKWTGQISTGSDRIRKIRPVSALISARCGEDFFYVVLVNLNAYILFTESFLVITLTNKLFYEFVILPDFCQFDVKNEPAGPDRMWKIRPVPTLFRINIIHKVLEGYIIDYR